MKQKMPFSKTKISVCQGVSEYKKFRDKYANCYVCPYLAYKTEEDWDKSTSRVYMNQVLENFLYIPVNVVKEDNNELIKFFKLIQNDDKVVSANVTQPHKSNPVLMAEFSQTEEAPENIDTLIREKGKKLVPFNLNAPSFMGWYNDEVGSMKSKTIILIGVGGVGRPLAQSFAESNPTELILIDPNDKSDVVKKLQKITKVSYYSSIQDIKNKQFRSELVVINAAGKEGAVENSGLKQFLTDHKNSINVFVDLRPHLDIDVVNFAKDLGWQSQTGHGMNARNDYSLLCGIAKAMDVEPITFNQFKKLVADAS